MRLFSSHLIYFASQNFVLHSRLALMKLPRVLFFLSFGKYMMSISFCISFFFLHYHNRNNNSSDEFPDAARINSEQFESRKKKLFFSKFSIFLKTKKKSQVFRRSRCMEFLHFFLEINRIGFIPNVHQSQNTFTIWLWKMKFLDLRKIKKKKNIQITVWNYARRGRKTHVRCSCQFFSVL